MIIFGIQLNKPQISKSERNFLFIKLTSDLNGYIHFQEILYETFREVYRHDLFKKGEGI